MQDFADHIVFAGGGTAGHLFPGLAVAECLRRHAPQLRISFVGTNRPFELRHVEAAGFEYHALASRPFPRRAREALRFVTDNVSGYYAARRLLTSENVSLVVGLGGYASVPTARAAAKLGIPYLLLEQNAVAGRATRWLAPKAALVCTAFEDVGRQVRGERRVRVTGNPLRGEFSKPQVRRAARNPVKRLVVLGGSGGARVLNEQVPRALYKSGESVAGWEIVHQSGERDHASTQTLYRKLGLEARVLPFVDDLPDVLTGCRLAISRAGGTTLAELAARGVPAILLPYPQATDDHQRKNADVFAAAGAAQVVDEREVVGRLDNHLAASIIELANDHPRRMNMAAAMVRLARPEAAERVGSLVGSLLRSRYLVAV